MKTNEKITPGGEVILYKSEDGSLAIDVKLEKETVWLTPVQMAKLFDKARPTILEHIKILMMNRNLTENQLVGNSDKFK